LPALVPGIGPTGPRPEGGGSKPKVCRAHSPEKSGVVAPAKAGSHNIMLVINALIARAANTMVFSSIRNPA
jgi:hypothetical protein